MHSDCMDVGSMLCVLQLKINRWCLPSQEITILESQDGRKRYSRIKISFKYKVIEMIELLGHAIQYCDGPCELQISPVLCLLLPRHRRNSRSFEFRCANGEAHVGNANIQILSIQL